MPFYYEAKKVQCRICGIASEYVSQALEVCVDCIRKNFKKTIFYLKQTHARMRAEFDLPEIPPKDPAGISCHICAHQCRIGIEQLSYCGLRKNKNGRLISKTSLNFALVHTYLDPIPTNCCASWFCEATQRNVGKSNLAVFAYGCGFNCLFCQNSDHKNIATAPQITQSELIKRALDPQVACVCFFGGSIEPQLPFALHAAEKIIKQRKDIRICWEWNGIGNENLVEKAAEISLMSGGNIKFDLKTFDSNLSFALCGVENKKTYHNFEMIAKKFFSKRPKLPVLCATTLLVPGYVDSCEVENIAKFIARLDPEIPYSLLVFHPDFYMTDMGITPKKQVEECYKIATKYLKRVNIGNRYLLG